jgi:hypothetical protein
MGVSYNKLHQRQASDFFFSDSANDYGDLHLRSHDLSKYRRQL